MDQRNGVKSAVCSAANWQLMSALGQKQIEASVLYVRFTPQSGHLKSLALRIVPAAKRPERNQTTLRPNVIRRVASC